MNIKKKMNLFGSPKKIRSLADVNAEYNHHAANIGHKMRVISELEDQVLEHRSSLVRLSAEADEAQKRENAQALQMGQQTSPPIAQPPQETL